MSAGATSSALFSHRRRQQPRHQRKTEQGAGKLGADEAGQVRWPDAEKVLVSDLAIATAGLAKEVEAVNQ